MKQFPLSNRQTDSLTALRQKAEEKLRTQIERLQKLSSKDIRDLVHELGTHQIELEMQNEELRRAQAELEASRSRYAELYDFAPVGYFTFDKDGLIREANLAGAQLLGIERRLLINKPFVGFIAEAGDREIFRKHWNEAFTGEARRSCEISLRKKDGTVFYAQLQSSATQNIDTKAGSLCTAILDITERKKAEETLRESQEQCRALAENSPDIVARFDRQMRHLYVNAHSEQVTGLPADRVVGKTNRELGMPQEIFSLLEKNLSSVFATGKPVTIEYQYTGTAGTGYYETRLIAEFATNGAVQSVLAVTRDITAHKQMEETLRKAHAELEQRVKERSGELTRANEQLSQEIVERKGAVESLGSAYAEIKELKDRFFAENIYLKQVIDREYNFGEIIGRSDAFQYVFFRVEQVAPQDTTVLLLGETGTGKGVVARAIHSRSSRKDQPMVTVNCSALPANLIESELFGREKGAFTGSSERQIGRFELADNGTLFLDEIGEMPLELQTKLLRVLQDGEFERLGGPKTIKVNVRIIASTNRNLDEAVRKGTFREDLFYRLNVFPITIPALRQRKDDIPLLVDHFVAKFNKKIGRKIETVSKDTLNILQEYDWPGNVRELESIIERAVITSQGSALQVLDRLVSSRTAGERDAHDGKALAALERDHILQALERTQWRIEGKKGAAAVLGLNPSTLRGRMRKDGIHRS